MFKLISSQPNMVKLWSWTSWSKFLYVYCWVHYIFELRIIEFLEKNKGHRCFQFSKPDTDIVYQYIQLRLLPCLSACMLNLKICFFLSPSKLMKRLNAVTKSFLRMYMRSLKELWLDLSRTLRWKITYGNFCCRWFTNTKLWLAI